MNSGGFLRLIPPSSSVKLKIRIYVIKVLINERSIQNPVLCISFGEKKIEKIQMKNKIADDEYLIAK